MGLKTGPPTPQEVLAKHTSHIKRFVFGWVCVGSAPLSASVSPVYYRRRRGCAFQLLATFIRFPDICSAACKPQRQASWSSLFHCVPAYGHRSWVPRCTPPDPPTPPPARLHTD